MPNQKPKPQPPLEPLPPDTVPAEKREPYTDEDVEKWKRGELAPEDYEE